MTTLLHVFPTFEVGGPQIRFVQIANRFGRVYRHIVVVLDGVTDVMQRLASDVDAQLLPLPARSGHLWSNVKTFRNVLTRVRPDLLVTYNWGSIEWAIANFDGRFRHLHFEDGFGPEEAEKQVARRVLTRRLVLRRSTVVVPSQTLYAIARNVWRLPPSRLFYVPNGIDCNRFNADPDPPPPIAAAIDCDLPVIGTVAGLRPEKNLFRLIDAFADLVRARPAVLAIVGDGPERSVLAAHAGRLGLDKSVIFTGMHPNPEQLLPSFAVFALSSDTEQMPLSVLEAMAAGLPVAATDVGDIRRMVAAENQPFIVERDAASLSRSIQSLLTDPARAAAIGAANRCRARQVFDQEIMLDNYRKLFDGEMPPSGFVVH